MSETQRDLLYPMVYQVVRQIPKGKVATYGQIARLLGLPNHARHVGFALSCLAQDSTVPWHRVVNAKGETHPRHGGQPSRQRQRLVAEGVIFNKNQRIPLKQFQWAAELLS